MESPSDRAAPMAGQTTQDRGRQQTRGRGDRGQSASCPGGAQWTTSNVPSTTTSEVTPPQQGSHAKASCCDPVLLAAKFHSCGWKKDLEHVLKVYYKHNLQAPFREAEWARVRDRFFEHLLPHKEEALSIKEGSPLDFMPLIEEQFWRAMGPASTDCEALHYGSNRGATTMDWWPNRATSKGAPTWSGPCYPGGPK